VTLPASAFGQAETGGCPAEGAVQLSAAQMKARLFRIPRIPTPGLWCSVRIGPSVIVFKVGTGEDGRVTCIHVARGHPLLVPAILEAVRTWSFRPTTVRGRRQPTIGTLVVRITRGKHGFETSVLSEEPPADGSPVTPALFTK